MSGRDLISSWRRAFQDSNDQMDEEKFYTRDELTTLSDLALIEVRSTYQRLRTLLEGETSAEDLENRDRIEELLKEIQEEMCARGITSTGPNTS